MLVGDCLVSSGLTSPGLTFVLPRLVSSAREEGKMNEEEGMRDGKGRDIVRCTKVSMS